MSEANGRLVRASSEQHKAFAESLIWQDYTDVITLWLEEVRTNLETERDPADVRRLQGVVSACREFLLLPERIAQALASQ